MCILIDQAVRQSASPSFCMQKSMFKVYFLYTVKYVYSKLFVYCEVCLKYTFSMLWSKFNVFCEVCLKHTFCMLWCKFKVYFLYAVKFV